MKKKLISLLFIVGAMLSLVLLPQTAMADYTTTAPTTGDGTADNPYQIASAENLAWFAAQVNTSHNYTICAKLTADIDLNSGYTFSSDGTYTLNGESTDTAPESWTPIGTYGYPYCGTFNGAGHTISGLYINQSSGTYLGLFGYLGGGSGSDPGTVTDLGIENSYICGSSHIGSICGYNYIAGTITNCYNEGYVTATNDYSGGICGYNLGTITSCYNTGATTGSDYAGGVCGQNAVSSNNTYKGTISYCYNTGSVKCTTSSSSSSGYAGGVCGTDTGSITGCYYLTDTAKVGIGDQASDTASKTTGKTSIEFASGEVCYLLNGDQQTIAFRQTLSAENTTYDEYPVFSTSSKQVYKYTDGLNAAHYTNHNYGDTGICTEDGETHYQPAAAGSDSVYYIKNAGNLYWFAQLVNGELTDTNTSANAKLLDDIDLNPGYTFSSEGGYTAGEGSGTPNSWTPIGASANYTGTFDGDNHTIKGLYIAYLARTQYGGLFGENGGTIKNLGIDNSYVYGYDGAGGICGYNAKNIENCHNSGLVQGSESVGGICGATQDNSGSSITNCYNTGTVLGSKNSSTTTAIDSYVGGVCGTNYFGATITNCYNTGEVSSYATSDNYVGGVCGRNVNSTITYCYNTGKASYTSTTATDNKIGGICGNNPNSGTIANCYYLTGTASYGIGSTSSDTANKTTVKTSGEFSSGEVAYLLNTGQTSIAWYQNVNVGTADTYPVLDSTHGKVYKVTFNGISTTSYAYSNYEGTVALPTTDEYVDWYTSDSYETQFTADTQITADTTVYAKSKATWETGSDAGYYAETADAETKEGVVRFLAKYAFDKSDTTSAGNVKSCGIWFMKTSGDTFSTDAAQAANENVAGGFYADITAVPVGTTCYAKAYVVISDNGTDKYVYSELITQKADFTTKWLGKKTSGNGDSDV